MVVASLSPCRAGGVTAYPSILRVLPARAGSWQRLGPSPLPAPPWRGRSPGWRPARKSESASPPATVHLEEQPGLLVGPHPGDGFPQLARHLKVTVCGTLHADVPPVGRPRLEVGAEADLAPRREACLGHGRLAALRGGRATPHLVILTERVRREFTGGLPTEDRASPHRANC